MEYHKELNCGNIRTFMTKDRSYLEFNKSIESIVSLCMASNEAGEDNVLFLSPSYLTDEKRKRAFAEKDANVFVRVTEIRATKGGKNVPFFEFKVDKH